MRLLSNAQMRSVVKGSTLIKHYNLSMWDTTLYTLLPCEGAGTCNRNIILVEVENFTQMISAIHIAAIMLLNSTEWPGNTRIPRAGVTHRRSKRMCSKGKNTLLK